MKEIYWRDKKLYRVAARDYGDLIHRSFGVIVNSIAKGMAFAVVVVVISLVLDCSMTLEEIGTSLPATGFGVRHLRGLPGSFAVRFRNRDSN